MIRGRVVVDEQRCKGCGLCVAACPQAVLRLSVGFNALGYHPATLVEDAERHCTGCVVCALVCPDVAITVYRQVRAGATAATAGTTAMVATPRRAAAVTAAQVVAAG